MNKPRLGSPKRQPRPILFTLTDPTRTTVCDGPKINPACMFYYLIQDDNISLIIA